MDTPPLEISPPQKPTIEHLSFPCINEESSAESSSSISPPERQLLKDRLYVGNLHPTVDEYTLLQVFSKFGRVTKLDFLFHKTGTLKGKPRGYAFIEYGSNNEALRALNTAHDKLLRGRKLVVTFAHQAPPDNGSIGVKRKSMMEASRPTTLSLLKTGSGNKTDATRDKIAMMEAKLRQMESTNLRLASISNSPSTPASASTDNSISLHPSLPPKPPPPLPEALATQIRPNLAKAPLPPLPSLPLQPQLQSLIAPGLRISPTPTRASKQKLTGVKLGKPKDKEKPKATHSS